MWADPGSGYDCTSAPALQILGRVHMGDVVSFALPDGGRVLAEPVGEDVYGLQEISVNGSTVVRRAQEGLGEALDGIRRMAAEAHTRLTSLDVAPQRLELEIGVKLSGETSSSNGPSSGSGRPGAGGGAGRSPDSASAARNGGQSRASRSSGIVQVTPASGDLPRSTASPATRDVTASRTPQPL
ncbi:CU044_2847 family protein [Streptomyces sp. NPDC020571]|uniref:CU044_2847 family protein n=1 Tax=Streptomyces sp. NPDC020571 TaxID=3365079 RepID=UPI00378AA716